LKEKVMATLSFAKATKVLESFRVAVNNTNGTKASQQGDVTNLFSAILDSPASLVSYSVASVVIGVLQDAISGYAGTQAKKIQEVNFLVTALRGTTKTVTLLQADSVLSAIHDAILDISDTPATQISDANKVVTLLLAL
jgi:hypothetical protein